jgi:acetyl-CoA decarbonylase/synthase complex subunit gamma
VSALVHLGGPAPHASPAAPWITGSVDTPAGPVPSVATRWTRRESLEHLRCRLGAFRERYAVPPGLYAIGRPGPTSEVLVTASYKLSFDHVRRAAGGLDAWVLVLDTRGVNVWCAAGKGTFGTEELVRRIGRVGLDRVVSHRRLVLPQLGAPGVSAHAVQRATRFRVFYGPVRAVDLPAYLAAGREATPAMRRVRFGLRDRAALVPIELVPAAKALAVFAAAVLLLFVIGPAGGAARRLATAAAVAGLGGVAVVAGAVLTPLLLPLVPGRAFALKGLLVGALLTAAYVPLVPALHAGGRLLEGFAWAFTPAASSWLALQFTGATTFTSMSGVRRELRYAAPAHVLAAAVAVALLVAHRVIAWRGA